MWLFLLLIVSLSFDDQKRNSLLMSRCVTLLSRLCHLFSVKDLMAQLDFNMFVAAYKATDIMTLATNMCMHFL